eukprot:CAMPEP_0184022362 /NCGR_PEP_ID=MMETSP0954-20121128/10562_1 /TAXON_ID=627963 /ORGANISM="Aplanochytrium sp, Strain PBS07" /LENGTH=213 /DNA_ID=CAMNT_0026304725 /DNA_START=121 /DNA_END=763 /DNA_ORIENTATION=-
MPPFRGRGSPGGRGRGRGGRGRGGRGGGGRFRDEGPPSHVIDLGTFSHAAEEDLVCLSTLGDKVPYFNAGVYLENKQKIGKVEEVFGPINAVMFTVKPDQGVVATSFKENDKVYKVQKNYFPSHDLQMKEKAVDVEVDAAEDVVDEAVDEVDAVEEEVDLEVEEVVEEVDSEVEEVVEEVDLEVVEEAEVVEVDLEEAEVDFKKRVSIVGALK